ncbi:MAG: hypothetical protein DDT19_02597 [Syntrophomonadaceae bacterium]|nr:hypothetical protein [Bacillota bacterium]
MRITHKPGTFDYRPGSYWKECPRCKFDYRIEEFKEDGMTKTLVCPACYDPKHPLEDRRKG